LAGPRRRSILTTNKPLTPAGAASKSDNEKFVELEFTLVKEELQHRMEFNRRILSLQMSLITGVLGAGFFKDVTTLDPIFLQIGCVILLVLNIAFLMEVTQNNEHIRLAAEFLVVVTAKKAESLFGPGVRLYEWEAFLTIKRKSWLSRRPFLFDGHMAMSVLFVLVASGLFWISLDPKKNPMPFNHGHWISVACVAIALVLNLAFFSHNVAISKRLKSLYDRKTLDAFAAHYNLK
jgi:hypothetical protein